jgi:integrase
MTRPYKRIQDTSKFKGRQPRIELTAEEAAVVERFEEALRNDPEVEQISQNTVDTYKRLAGYIISGNLDLCYTTLKNGRKVIKPSYKQQLRSVILYLEDYSLLPPGFEKPEELFPQRTRRRKGSKRTKLVDPAKIIPPEALGVLLRQFPQNDRGYQVRVLCLICYHFGLRLAEGLRIHHATFLLNDTGDKLRLPAFITKGRKPRTTFDLANYDPDLRPFYQDALKTFNSFTISEGFVKYQFTKARNAMDHPDWTFHSLRHSFATRAVEVGVDIRTLSKALGHYSIDFTDKVYVHPDE